MPEVDYESSRKGSWDDTLKAGDLITSYWKGIYKLISVEMRGDNKCPLFHFHTFAKECGEIRSHGKQINKVCDASYCARVTKDYVEARLDDLRIQASNWEAIKANI